MKILFRSLVIVVLGLGTASVAQAGFFDDWFGGGDAQDAAGEKPVEANVKAGPPPPPPGPDANPIQPLTTLPNVNTLTPEQLVRYQLTQCQDQLDQCQNPRLGSYAPDGMTGRGILLLMPKVYGNSPGLTCQFEGGRIEAFNIVNNPASEDIDFRNRLYELILQNARTIRLFRSDIDDAGRMEAVSHLHGGAKFGRADNPVSCRFNPTELGRLESAGRHENYRIPTGVADACWNIGYSLGGSREGEFQGACDLIWLDQNGNVFIGNFRRSW